MLKLIDSLESHGLVEVASDAHVPLSVEWQSGGVYAFYRPASPAGGVGCEFALDAVDGRIARVVVVDLPLRLALTPGSGSHVATRSGQPVFSRTDFDLDSAGEPRRNSVTFRIDQSVFADDEQVGILLAPSDVRMWMEADGVRFGIDDGDNLIAVAFQRSLIPPTSELHRF